MEDPKPEGEIALTPPITSLLDDETKSTPPHSVHHDQEKGLGLKRTLSVAETMSPIREFFFVSLLCSTQFVTQAGLLNTLNILHAIGNDLGIEEIGVLAWLIAGYSLTVGTFILLSGRCGDIFGFKIMIIVGFVWFAIWNMVAGCAVYVDGSGGQVLFIFARVLQGIGPAILLPNGLGLLGATYANGRKKEMIFSLFGACAPVGAIVGGTFGALFNLAWWPWTFWSFAIVLIVLSVISIFVLPSVPLKLDAQNLSFREKIQDLDLLGASVGITAMILFNFAWNQAPGFGWNQAYIYVLLIVSLLLFPIFFWIELRIAKKPLIPFDVLNVNVSFVMICIACGWAAFGIWLYYFVQILQELRGNSPLLTVAYMSPLVPSGFIAAITTGRVISRIGPGWVMAISMAAFLVGCILTATLPVHQIYWAQIFVTTLIISWGMDMSFPAGTLITSDAVAKEHQGTAASLINTVVNYSISIGVGIAGTVEMHVNNGALNKADELKGYRGALYLAVGFSGLGLFCSLLLLKMNMSKR